MKVAAAVLALAGSAAAFAPSASIKASSAISASVLDDLPGSSAPIKSFDPAGLASIGSDETLKWFQAAEIKNGRCAMVATTGFLIQAAGLHFPGMLSHDVSFESLSGMHPFEQWAAVPDAGTLNFSAHVDPDSRSCSLAKL